MSYLQAINYDQYFDMGQKYQHKFFMLPKDLPLESFVIEIDDDDDDEVDVKVEDVGCEELRVDVDDEILEFINRVSQESAFDFFCEWYHVSFYGTLEHPIPLTNADGEITTARSYYNCKNAKMVEMKLVFYQEQLEQTKKFLEQVGFSFDKVDVSLFAVTNTNEQGSVYNPHPYYDATGEMLVAYNCYTKEETQTMCEMRLVFDGDQYQTVIDTLKAGGFSL
jgi:hypothetical protein